MYIVIDTFDPYWPTIVTDPDSGAPLMFDSREEAQEEANQCQDAIVVEL